MVFSFFLCVVKKRELGASGSARQAGRVVVLPPAVSVRVSGSSRSTGSLLEVYTYIVHTYGFGIPTGTSCETVAKNMCPVIYSQFRSTCPSNQYTYERILLAFCCIHSPPVVDEINNRSNEFVWAVQITWMASLQFECPGASLLSQSIGRVLPFCILIAIDG